MVDVVFGSAGTTGTTSHDSTRDGVSQHASSTWLKQHQHSLFLFTAERSADGAVQPCEQSSRLTAGRRASQASGQRKQGDFSRAGSLPKLALLQVIVPFVQRLGAHRLFSANPNCTRPAHVQSFLSTAHAHHWEPPPGRTAMCVSVGLQVCSLSGGGVSRVALVASVSFPPWSPDSCVVVSLPEVSLPPECIRVIEVVGGGGVVDPCRWATSPSCVTLVAAPATASRSTCQQQVRATDRLVLARHEGVACAHGSQPLILINPGPSLGRAKKMEPSSIPNS